MVAARRFRQQLELATQLQEEYVNGRERLTRETIELGARVRSKRLGALGLESDQLKYAEQLWRLHLHSRRIIRRFADVLTAEQTASLRQALLQTPDRARGKYRRWPDARIRGRG